MFRAAVATLLGALALGSGIDALTIFPAAQSSASPPRSASPRPSDGDSTEAEVRTACTPCHAFPPADVLPRSRWRDELVRMSVIRENQPEARAGAVRLAVLPPDFERALRFFESHAPERLPAPTPWPEADRMGFVIRSLAPDEAISSPAIANVRFADVDGDPRLELLVSDMHSGAVMMGRPYLGRRALMRLAELSNPAHVSMTDFDKDGIKDFLVADLGRFAPSDHNQGAIVLLRGKGALKYDTLALDGWPRVADVEAGDFNGDGTPDLLVAAFGWRKTGKVSVLENHTVDYRQPSFVERIVEVRPGAIHAIPTDLNGDGKLDFVVVLSQQFETVVAYIHDGTSPLAFTPNVIYTAPHPDWGCSGIELVDLDGDGDLDVLLSHGDTFDIGMIKPHHGIQWLENKGGYPFVEHTLAELPGVSRAQAADIDGDGDLDIVAGTFNAMSAGGNDPGLPSLVWLEQQSGGRFVQHTLEVGNPWHATLDLADFDRDGDVDIAVGNFYTSGGGASAAAVEIWENQHLAAERSTR